MKQSKLDKIYCDALNSRAGAYVFVGDLGRAKADIKKCMHYAKRSGNEKKIGELHILESSIYDNEGKYNLMKKYVCKANEVFLRIGNKSGIYMSENNMGLYYSNVGSYSKALKHFRNALDIARHRRDAIWQAHTMTHIGLTYTDMGNFDKSMKWAKKSLNKAQKSGDKQSESASHNNIAIVYLEMDNMDKAFEHIHKALNISLEIGDRFGSGSILNNAGAVSFYLGKNDKALDYFKQSMAVRKRIGDVRGISTLMNNIGYILNEQGKMSEGLKYYRQCLELKREIRDKQGEADALRNIGYSYMVMGNFEKSLKYARKSIDLSRIINDHIGQTENLYNLFHIFLLRGNKHSIKQTYDSYCKVASNLKDKNTRVRSLIVKSLMYLHDGRPGSLKQAKKTGIQIMALTDKSGSKIYRIDSMITLGRIELALNNQDAAFKHLSNALTISRELNDLYRTGQILYYLHSVSEIKSNNMKYLREAIRVFRTLNAKYWLEQCRKQKERCN